MTCSHIAKMHYIVSYSIEEKKHAASHRNHYHNLGFTSKDHTTTVVSTMQWTPDPCSAILAFLL